MKAKTLKEATNKLDPQQSLQSGDDLRHYYVSRDWSQFNELLLFLEDTTAPQKILFTGHRGNGKSTELARLSQHLRDKYKVIHFSVKETLDLADLEYRDILISLALKLSDVVVSENIPVSETLLRAIELFTKEITIENEEKSSIGGEAEVGFKFYFAKIMAKLKTEQATRKVVREKVEHRVSELMTNIYLLVQEIKRATTKEVLLIIEDLDKTDPDRARRLFFEHGVSLASPLVSIIYTFPVALRHDKSFMQIKHTYNKTYSFPNINCKTREGVLNDVGVKKLKEILTKKVDASLFVGESLFNLALSSGGIPRELISIAQDACLTARVAGSDVITSEHVKKVVQSRSRDFQIILKPDQIELLREVYKNKPTTIGDEHQDLLHNLSMLEYWNGEVWYDINPVIESIVTKAN